MVLDEKGNSDGFVINPFGGNVIFNQSMIRALEEEKKRLAKGGVVEQLVKKDTAVQLGQPRIYPKEMVKAITDYLKKQKNVKAAYLQLMIKEEEQSYLVIIDFTGDKREVFNGVAKATMSYLNGMFIDMVPFDSEFGHNATKNIEPFYKRKMFGLHLPKNGIFTMHSMGSWISFWLDYSYRKKRNTCGLYLCYYRNIAENIM